MFVCESKHSLGLFRIFLVLHIFTALGYSCKAPIFRHNFADGWANYGNRHPIGHYSCTTAWMWKQGALASQAAHLTKFHFTDLTSNLVVVAVPRPSYNCKQQELICVGSKAARFTNGTARPIHQPSFSNTDIYSIRLRQGNSSTLPSWADKERVRMLSVSEKLPHKHLISPEVVLKTKILRIWLHCREYSLLQRWSAVMYSVYSSPHLAEYVGACLLLQSVGHRY